MIETASAVTCTVQMRWKLVVEMSWIYLVVASSNMRCTDAYAMCELYENDPRRYGWRVGYCYGQNVVSSCWKALLVVVIWCSGTLFVARV